MAREPITCPLCRHQDYLDGRDMGEVPGYDGYTIGPRGRTKYHFLTWCSSGHAIAYRDTPEGLVRRWVNGDSMITIHFKPDAPPKG